MGWKSYFKSELLRHKAEEALGPSVGPGITLLGAAHSEADDPQPGVPP